MPLADRSEILRLHEAAVACDHASRRTALLGGIDQRLRDGLPTAPDALAQLLSDLTALSDVGRLPDGTAPLVTWAMNAATLAEPRTEAAVFRSFVERHAAPATPAAPTPVAPSAPPPVAPSTPPRGVPSSSTHQSTVISYGADDEPFARRLRDALRAQGVLTFLFADDAVPGMPLHRVARQTINEHDRVILICSRSSLGRRRVLNDIEEVLRRETRDGGVSYLIPIRLDKYVLDEWSPADPGVADAVRDRFVVDFEGAAADSAKFEVALRGLIAALMK